VPVYAVSTFWKASRATTVVEKATPAVCGEPAVVTVRCVAAEAPTVTDELPVIEPVALSVAVTERPPAVLRVTPPANVFWPLSPAWNAYAEGSTAWPSLDVNATVPP